MKYKETIGANEVIRKPPVSENANDPDSMIRLEGQAMGRLGEKPRSWFVIIFMWLSFLGPVWLIGLVSLLIGSGDMGIWVRIVACVGLLFMSIITHIPVVQAIRIRISG